MRVEPRALIFFGDKLVVTQETRRGYPHSAIPGGGVNLRETVEQALVREVEEETGLVVKPQRLLYVAEVVSRYSLHDLELFFLASPVEPAENGRYRLIDLEDSEGIHPPILDRLAKDRANGWPERAVWLGNLYDNTAALW